MKEMVILGGVLLAAAVLGKYLAEPKAANAPRMMHKHGESGLSFDFFACHSGIGNWNAAGKVFLSIFLLVICLGINTWQISMAVILISIYITVILGRIPWCDYLKIMMIPAAFLVLGSIPIAFEVSRGRVGSQCVHLGSFFIGATRENIRKVIYLWLKAGGAVSAMFMLSLSTPMHEVVAVLKKIRIPSILIELMNLMYRYIFVLLDTQNRMKNAAKSRLGYCDYKTSLYSFGRIGGNLFLVSLKKASAYYDAMESRCYDGELEFLEEEKPVTKEQAVVMGFVVIYLIVVGVITR